MGKRPPPPWTWNERIGEKSAILSASDDNTLKLWNPETGEVLSTLPLPGRPASIEIHPTNPHLVAVSLATGVCVILDTRLLG